VLRGPARRVLRDPSHPYARGLLASIPRLSDARLPVALDGRPPAPGAVGGACGFADRCALVEARCRTERPSFEIGADGESVRCHRHALARTLPVRAEGKAATKPAFGAPVLNLEGLAISYAKPTFFDQILGRKPKATPTVADVSIAVRKGETIGLVGESGSGKSTILKTVAGLVFPSLGRISLADGEALPEELDRRTPSLLRRVQLVFQNPDESLNPRHTIEEILSQPLKLYFGLTGAKLRETCGDLLESVRLGRHYLDRLPSQLSGGEKQRVAIARAFAAEPEIVLCDEVTSALDVSVQAAVLDLLDRLKREHGTTYIFVSHDLAVVRAISDRVAVLYQGRLCEIGTAADVYAFPSHPYTEALLGAALEPDPDSAPRLTAADVVESSPPSKGCPFQRRCPRRIGPICDEQTPSWSVTESGHAIRCHISREELYSAQALASVPA
jgi:peptide/nickel transport system ATP-binding protein